MYKLKAYYINLQKSFKRKLFIEKQWQSIRNIELVRVEATDAEKINFCDFDFYQPHKYKNHKWALTKPELAIFDSHRRIWKEIAEAQCEYAIVMEDDMIIGEDFEKTIEKIIEKILQRVGLIKLSGTRYQKRVYGKSFKVENDIFIRKIVQPTPCSGCYILTKKTAYALWKKSQKSCEVADDYLFYSSGLREFQLFEPIAEQVYVRKARQQKLTEEQKKIDASFREEPQWKDCTYQKGPLLFRIKNKILFVLKRKLVPKLFRVFGFYRGFAILKEKPNKKI